LKEPEARPEGGEKGVVDFGLLLHRHAVRQQDAAGSDPACLRRYLGGLCFPVHCHIHLRLAAELRPLEVNGNFTSRFAIGPVTIDRSRQTLHVAGKRWNSFGNRQRGER